MDGHYRIAIVVATVLALMLLERRRPLRLVSRTLWPRLIVNLGVSVLAFVTATFCVRPTAMWLLQSTEIAGGVLQWLPTSGWWRPVAGFLLMDLSFYYWHRLNHRLPWLWRFHLVHHTDPDLDVSTAFRFHFGEILLSTVLRITQVLFIGLSLGTFVIYELAMMLNTLFHHSNVRLPTRCERWLNMVLVTPRMHGIHHSQRRTEADSNYSVVLPWWDALHRSLRLDVPQEQLHIGVPAYTKAADNRWWSLLTIPFRRQRDDWAPTEPDGAANCSHDSLPAEIPADPPHKP